MRALGFTYSIDRYRPRLKGGPLNEKGPTSENRGKWGLRLAALGDIRTARSLALLLLDDDRRVPEPPLGRTELVDEYLNVV